jgi:hypothetical protein
MSTETETDKYLGDGLYASYDGYQISLKANSSTEPSDIVFLEPKVIRSLELYINQLRAGGHLI